MDLVDIPEHRREPSEDVNPCFHPSRTARSDRRSTPIHLICLESGPDAASRRSIWGKREYDILLNTTQTVLCRPGVAYQPDSVLSVINYQPDGTLYNMLPRIPPMDLGAPASGTPALPGGEEVRGHVRSPLPVSDATVFSDPPPARVND